MRDCGPATALLRLQAGPCNAVIPQATPGRPEIDGAILPVISAASWTRLTGPWLANAHRARGRSAA
jgi:hypothetical protein